MPDNQMDRRGFLKSTAAGMSSFFMLSSNDKERLEEKKKGERRIIYRTLGRTGLKVPVVGMGVFHSGDPNLLRAALDAGVMVLDTAYGYSRGQSEELIGRVVKNRRRDSFVVGTKAGLPRDPLTERYTEQANKAELFYFKMVDTSLKRLQLEYVDILFLHDAKNKEMVVFEPAFQVMEKLKKDGKARFLGVSCHKNEPEVIQAVIDSKIFDVILVSYNFRQKHYLSVRDAIAKAAQAGIGVIAMKAIGGPLAHDPLRPVNAGAALKWVLQDPNVHSTVPGFCTFEEMDTDLAVMQDLTMTDPEKEYLQKQASLPSLYCQQCGKCMKQCPEKIPIPDLMRAYMYTYGYRNLNLARDLVVSLGLPRKICDDCGSCLVKCAIGFNVQAKIRDVVRVRDIPAEFLA